MKQFSTFILSSKKIIFLVFFSLPIMVQAQFLLNQNFNSSTLVADYIGNGANQLTYIGVTTRSSSNSVYGSGNRINLQRYSGGAALVKSNLTSTPATFIRAKFKLNVPFNSIPTAIPQTQATIYFGSNILDTTLTTAEVRHSSVGIGFGSSGKFYLRTQVSPNFVNTIDSLIGEQEINWFINNSGGSLDYANPTGSGTTTLDNDRYDLWIGSTRVFSNQPATTAAADITGFKVLFNGAIGGGVSIDDIEITTGNEALPVSIKSFTASITGSSNQLTWSTASELNNKGFDVQRQSKNGGEWESLGFVNGTNRATTYTFKDNNPLVNSFYRLRQVDMDGKATYSKVVSINNRMKDKIIISPNPATDKVIINLNQIDLSNLTVTASLYDLTGKRVLSKNAITGTFELDLSSLSKGIYSLTIQSANFTYNEKIIRQ
ncbi:MAG: T9SS type A sorting domain-containing protein [Chitinophagaceae bacterium]|jgi:hypothetical protein|nr:T9SS type A sorting domain-containing protein [Chitinophagaceae bacterium]